MTTQNRLFLAMVCCCIPNSLAEERGISLEKVRRQIEAAQQLADKSDAAMLVDLGNQYAKIGNLEVIKYLFDRGGRTSSSVLAAYKEERDAERLKIFLLVILEGSDIGWWDDPPGNMQPGSKFREATAFWIVDDVRKHFPDRTITKADLCVKATRRAYGAELRAKLGLPPLPAQEGLNPSD